MVKQAAHDSWDECSIHSGLTSRFYEYIGPSAGIGRQGKFKLYWWNIMNVQVVSRIHNKNYYFRGDMI